MLNPFDNSYSLKLKVKLDVATGYVLFESAIALASPLTLISSISILDVLDLSFLQQKNAPPPMRLINSTIPSPIVFIVFDPDTSLATKLSLLRARQEAMGSLKRRPNK